MGRNFPAIEFAGKKSPHLAFSNVDRYDACTVAREDAKRNFRNNRLFVIGNISSPWPLSPGYAYAYTFE